MKNQSRGRGFAKGERFPFATSSSVVALADCAPVSFLCLSRSPNCRVTAVMSEKAYDVRVEGNLEIIKGLLEQGYEYVCDFQDGPIALKMFRRSVGVRERAFHDEGVVPSKMRSRK